MLLLDLVLILADGAAPSGLPAPTLPPAAAAPWWLSPDVLIPVLTFLGLGVGRLSGRFAWLKRVADFLAIVRSHAVMARAIDRFKTKHAEFAAPLLAMLQEEANADGIDELHRAVVGAVTKGAAPMPTTAPGVLEVLTTSDPVAAVRAATARLEKREGSTPLAIPPAAAALLLACALLAGCVAPEAIAQCDAQAQLCHDDALDTSIPLEARQGGADNCCAWCQQRLTLTGDPVPASLTWAPLPPELDPPPVEGAPGGGR